MPKFVATHDSALSPTTAWERITDWVRHAEFVPFTTISIPTGGPNRVGTVFLARTGIGRFGFDDPMEVVEWSAPHDGQPGRCRLVKRGSVMTGWAELVVEPSPLGSRTTWTEDITVAKLPRFADGATLLSSRLLFTRVLRGVLGAEK